MNDDTSNVLTKRTEIVNNTSFNYEVKFDLLNDVKPPNIMTRIQTVSPSMKY